MWFMIKGSLTDIAYISHSKCKLYFWVIHGLSLCYSGLPCIHRDVKVRSKYTVKKSPNGKIRIWNRGNPLKNRRKSSLYPRHFFAIHVVYNHSFLIYCDSCIYCLCKLHLSCHKKGMQLWNAWVTLPINDDVNVP